jgi:hypothetical protein
MPSVYRFQLSQAYKPHRSLNTEPTFAYWSALRWTGELCGINTHCPGSHLCRIVKQCKARLFLLAVSRNKACYETAYIDIRTHPHIVSLSSIEATKIHVLILYPAVSGMSVTPSFTSSTRDTFVCLCGSCLSRRARHYLVPSSKHHRSIHPSPPVTN